ncbi:uncharacterized protein [Phyllobates terribilis]|uniref:uncharacterized protein n=1 Tax=Phyllobates terribilis TaxID=111132 RepID=UPI003CCB0662
MVKELKPKGKRQRASQAQKKASNRELQKPKDDVSHEPPDVQSPLPDLKSSEVSTSLSDEIVPVASIAPISNDKQENAEDNALVIHSSLVEELSKDQSEAIPSVTNVENSTSSSSSDHDTGNVPLSASKDPIIEPLQDINAIDPLKPDQEINQSLAAETPVLATKLINDKKRSSDAAEAAEPTVSKAKQPDEKTNSDQNKEQDQLEEAQGLLKSTSATGQSKEARLARVCAGLSSRLQEYKSECAQLEELLTAERELSKSYEDQIKQLQHDLSATKEEITRAETNVSEALAAKNSEIESLVSSLDALKKQAATSEGNLVSLQANMEALMRNRELTETRMTQALRGELASAERRAEEERTAHNSTKMAAMEREVELERRAAEASTALARAQRISEERTAKAAELEQRVALLEVECSSLNQELQDMEARVRRGQKRTEDTNQVIQIQAWQEEVERARQGQRDAESKLSSVEAEVQKMRVEMGAMKRDAEHYSRQEHMELEKRYRELTDLLYYKQTQLETMASEKAAAEFQMEKEIKRIQETQAEAEKSRVPRRASSYWEEDTDMKELELLPLHQRHLVGASNQLRKAAKFLDSGAVRATRFLWRYPTARVSLLCYLIFVHLFLMYLLHCLQVAISWLNLYYVLQFHIG